MDKHYQQATVLLEQGRHDLAAEKFRLALADDPENGPGHAMLALCLCAQDQFLEATQEAQTAIRLAPDFSLAHSVLARALLNRNRPDEAERAVREAIRLDPEGAEHYSLLAAIRFQRRDWEGTLRAADDGVALDAEHVGCNNLRAMALVKLGRSAEADTTLESTLARDPENALSHANQGWALLHQGQTKKALEHFREALRLEPGMEFARAGIIEALKAQSHLRGDAALFPVDGSPQPWRPVGHNPGSGPGRSGPAATGHK